MGLIAAIYVVLLIIFFVASALIFRHTVKYSYLSPRFKKIVLVFGIIALVIILLSFYLLFKLYAGTPSATPFSPSVSTPGNIQF